VFETGSVKCPTPHVREPLPLGKVEVRKRAAVRGVNHGRQIYGALAGWQLPTGWQPQQDQLAIFVGASSWRGVCLIPSRGGTMTTSPAQLIQALLANPRDLANVKSVTTPDVTYVSLNEDNPELKRYFALDRDAQRARSHRPHLRGG